MKAKLKADNPHFARSRLLCLENTCGGRVLPLDYHSRAAEFCATQGLALHLDGARLFNATQQQGVTVQDITRHYDSVSLCMSKGLGAPVASLLVGEREIRLVTHLDIDRQAIESMLQGCREFFGRGDLH